MNRTTMTESLFKAIKYMTAGGASIQEICEYYNVSSATVSRVRAAENFTEYKNMSAAVALAYREKCKARKTAPVPANDPEPVREPERKNAAAYYAENRVIQALRDQNEALKKSNELLTLISNKLVYIVEQLS